MTGIRETQVRETHEITKAVAHYGAHYRVRDKESVPKTKLFGKSSDRVSRKQVNRLKASMLRERILTCNKAQINMYRRTENM